MIDSFVLLAYASLTVSRTLFQRLLASLNFTLDLDLFCCYIRKKWFLWTMAAAQAAESDGDEWGLTWYLGLRIYIYISTPTWTHSQNLLAAAEAQDILLSNDHEYHPNQYENSHKIWLKVNGNWNNIMIRISKWRESHCRINASIRRKKNPKEQDCKNHRLASEQ